MSTLVDGYDGVVCDLDGVVYRGDDAVPHAVESLRSLGVPVVYVTNNASRTPDEVAAHLTDLGLEVSRDGVLTSSVAAAAEVADRLEPGARVLAVGGAGVAHALAEQGLQVVRPGGGRGSGNGPEDAGTGAAGVQGVLQGYGAQVTAADLAEAAYAVEAGATWVATNDDLTLPTERGVAPGNGTLVAAVAQATGATPVVVGKPHEPLYLLGCRAVGTTPTRTLGVGDRLETDVAGATAAGMDSVLVLTGVHGYRHAALAPPEQRPTYVVADLRELARPYEPARRSGGGWRCGTAAARVVDGRWDLTEDGAPRDPADGADPSTPLARAMLAALHEALDGGDVDDATARRLAGMLPGPR